MRLTTIILGLVICLCGCGEDKNVCEKAFEIRTSESRDWCKYVLGNNTCWQCPCKCLKKGRQWEVQGYRDIGGVILPGCDGTCLKKPLCEGTLQDESVTCLDDEAACAENQIEVPGIAKLMELGIYPCEENYIGYENCSPSQRYSCE